MEQVLEKDEGVRHLFEVIAGIRDGDECVNARYIPV